MRYLICLIITSFLFSNSIWSQEDDISQEKWNNIVDYANAKVTLAYLDHLFKSNSLKKENDRKAFIDTLKPKLESSSLKAPVSYDTIRALMDSNFKLTFEKLSSKIDSVKLKPHVLDTLFIALQNGLTGIQKNEIYNSSLVKTLKKEIRNYSEIKPEADSMASFTPKSATIKARQNLSILNLSNILIGILTLSLFLLIYMVIKKGKEINSLERDLDRKRKESEFEKLSAAAGNQGGSRRVDMRIKQLEKELKEARETIISMERLANNSESELHSESAVVVEFDVPKAPPAPKEFYAGKPTQERKFTEVLDKIKEQETVFKLTFTDSSRTQASFEVILASEFMQRQITNSPDDFLYRVCNNANSNQDFTRDIITERKGIAHLRDGVWVVDENDKALIKFQ